MSAIHVTRQWLAAARTRRMLIEVLIDLPLLTALYLLSSRFLSTPLSIAVTLAIASILLLYALKSFEVLDTAWLIRQLDQRLGTLEDSSDLLFKQAGSLSTLQKLQRERIEQRVVGLSNVDLRESWPWRKILGYFSIAVVLTAIAIFWPRTIGKAVHDIVADVPIASATETPIALVGKTIRVQPPAYTGLPLRTEKNLQIKFSEGSSLNWRLKFSPEPASVNLLFHDGSRLNLKKIGDGWQGSKILLQSSLYRVQVDKAPLKDDKLYRLDAIKDLAPQIRVIQPDRNLSLVELGQTDWPLSFEAEDEYGLGVAQLRIQLAQGSGENIKFTEQTRNMAGQGSRTRKRFSQQLDLTSLGVGPGDDVIVQFSISDQHSPQVNTTRSSSFILRWPAEASVETTGVEGLVQKAIPAYFRSQRQIIIDTEKLLAERKKYSAENFAIQSDTIGVDQRILRLRYGQFLGEEAEGGRDESASPSAKEGKDEHGEHAGEPPKKAAVSAADSNLAIAAEFGHVHDIAEAATLLDPKTKSLLRSALDEMWQAELNLRQGQPKQALPYEYRALAFIKKVQQADRIYLARVGLELPPIDETRRLSGDRSSVKNRQDVLRAANNEDLALMKFWQSLNQLELGTVTRNGDAPDFIALRQWIREHPSRSADSLGLLVAMDTLEKQPGCGACLAEMKTQLWPMLQKPPAIPQQRTIPDPGAQKYLDREWFVVEEWLVLALLLGSGRYSLALWRSEASQRPKPWRIAAILVLQIVGTLCLYFTLFPPPGFTSAERLVILTANFDTVNAKISGRVLALPEAAASANSEPVPDLATALRRYPGVHQLQIIGDGLGPRDQDAARGLSIKFDPSPLPQGLVELSLPEKISGGTRWQLQGRVRPIDKARVELLDPGNAVVATAQADPDGYFMLADTARTAGLAMYHLRILDERKKILDTVKLPLNIVQEKPLRVLSLSGGPNPELKYLRRWALDAGIELQSQVNLSVGVQMDTAAISINAASLRDLDLLILDERAWSTMNRGSKQSVTEALRNGMGVLLRITGPISANDRSELRALGFTVADANIVQGIHLDSAGDKKSRPALSRRPLMVSSPDGVTLLRDDANNPLALWRAEGRGRMGVMWLTDTYQLLLSGDSSGHGQIWQDAVSSLARTRNETTVSLPDRDARLNTRMRFCNIGPKTYVREPEAGISYLVLDAATGSRKCAAYWPRHSGWHLVSSDAQQLPFYVRDANETPGIKANAIREATLLLAAKHSTGTSNSRIPVPGSPWPWFFGWLLFTALLWWLERSKLGFR